jgi:hypothetical protein
MPGLRDLLKKKDKITEESTPGNTLSPPEFTFIRTTTSDFERIEPPTYPEDDQPLTVGKKSKHSGEHKRTLGFRSISSSSTSKRDAGAATPSAAAETNTQQLPTRPKSERRLSDVLHLHRRSRSTSAEPSSNLPEDLPEAEATVIERPRSRDAKNDDDKEAREHREAQWEKRATILAKNSPLRDGVSETAQSDGQAEKRRSKSPSISDATGDVNIQEAIRLHESGDLTRSTEMFGQLARPEGANNALAQVLFGLALRHGWGVTVEPERAIHFLSLAASNSASIEEEALTSSKKGGAAKGELVLAIYELANCFRYGWGVKKDATAARTYYETAANLGDTDAMEEAAKCFLEGFGGPKDKVSDDERATRRAFLHDYAHASDCGGSVRIVPNM